MSDWIPQDGTFYRRRLPHWSVPFAQYFITFNTLAPRVLSPAARDLVLSGFIHDCEFETIQAVIMPDHCHALLESDHHKNLSHALRRFKGRLAREVNLTENRTGATLWQPESYDRVVRDEREFEEIASYIANNPVKQGLALRPQDYRWYYARWGECSKWAWKLHLASFTRQVQL